MRVGGRKGEEPGVVLAKTASEWPSVPPTKQIEANRSGQGRLGWEARYVTLAET
jgi:hypothetical protein